MHMNWKKFALVVNMVGPQILTLVNPELAPIAGKITHAIVEAEAIAGASGVEKAMHVKNIAQDAVTSANLAGANINASAVEESIQEGIDTVVAVTKIKGVQK